MDVHVRKKRRGRGETSRQRSRPNPAKKGKKESDDVMVFPLDRGKKKGRKRLSF